MARSVPEMGIGADGTQFGPSALDSTKAAPAAGLALVAGTVIDDKYRLEHVIGEGGMGSVWRAHHLQLDLPVAIKVLRAGADRETLSARMRIEARAVARLVNPAIVRVFDIDTSEAHDPFIVMELLTGENLSAVLDRGPLSGVKAVQLLLPIAEALALAHAKGIAHRDLKPHNIFLAEQGGSIQPKLLDFGIAKLMSSPMPSGSLTTTGVLLGSPDYMSPEQARGQSDVDYRADIWQFCAVLHETITTQTPFTGDNYNALMRAIVEDEPRPLPLDDDTDERLAGLIAWGLRKDREERPDSMQTLAQNLVEWLLIRGETEDICGVALAPKWLGRAAQESPRRAPPSPASPSRATSKSAIARADTLVSASDAASELNARERPDPRVLVKATSDNPIWLVLGLLALGIGVAWFATRSPATRPEAAPEAREPLAAPKAAPTLAPTATATEPTPAAVEIPPVMVGAIAASASAGPAVAHSASPLSRPSAAPSSRPSDEKSPAPRKPAPANQPGRDVHDETRELLQAY
jgi:eukaryotic-like serine/threonine-protein kinase